MSDMYTDVERSIYKHFDDAIAAKGWAYKVFNNMVSKEDIADVHAGLSFMRYSDVFAPENGGGVKAQIKELVETTVEKPKHYVVQDWPDPFQLTYQFIVVANQLQDCRNLDGLIREVLRPRRRMMLWDSVAEQWTESYCDYTFAGYINRDVPADQTYWRVTNIRFDVFNFNTAQVEQPAILETEVITSVDGQEESHTIDSVI